MDVYAHFSCARQMETESPPRFANEVRNDWTSGTIKTRTTKIRSAHLEEVFFFKKKLKSQLEIHEKDRIFPHMGFSLRDSARWDAGQIRRGCCRKKKKKKKTRTRLFTRSFRWVRAFLLPVCASFDQIQYQVDTIAHHYCARTPLPPKML